MADDTEVPWNVLASRFTAYLSLLLFSLLFGLFFSVRLKFLSNIMEQADVYCKRKGIKFVTLSDDQLFAANTSGLTQQNLSKHALFQLLTQTLILQRSEKNRSTTPFSKMESDSDSDSDIGEGDFHLEKAMIRAMKLGERQKKSKERKKSREVKELVKLNRELKAEKIALEKGEKEKRMQIICEKDQLAEKVKQIEETLKEQMKVNQMEKEKRRQLASQSKELAEKVEEARRKMIS